MSVLKNVLTKWTKLLGLLALAAAAVFGVHQFMERRFCLEHICLAEEVSKDEPLLSSEKQLLDSIFEQSFTYLDRGKQSYAFISQDGRYVLKLFDFYRMKRRAAIESKHQAKRELIQQKRLSQLMRGYDIGYRFDRENSGLVFVNLVPNSQIEKTIVVTDWWGVKHIIPLGRVPFVVQRLAVPARIEIASLLERGDVAQAKERFSRIIELYVSGYQRGIVDDDHNVMYNTGFLDGKAMRIDLGRLRMDDSYRDVRVYQSDLDKVVHQRIDGWMERHYPQYKG